MSQYYINIPSSLLSSLKSIEQIWRQMKREIKHYYLKSKEFLQELTIKTYNESISGTKVYDKWLETYIPKVW